MKGPDEAGRGFLIKLSVAAAAAGLHVETLRLRIRRGELAAVRGPHGAYFLTRAVVAAIRPPTRSARRSVAVESLEWTWLALAQRAEAQGATRNQQLAIDRIQSDPTLSKGLHRLFTVQRLRIAGLSSAEIADLTGVSRRHVRRLTRQSLTRSLELGLRRRARDLHGDSDEDDEEEDDLEGRLHQRFVARESRSARRIVAGIQRRLEESGFRYHQRPRQPRDMFIPKRLAPAHKMSKLDRETIRHLLDGGLSAEEVSAIRLVGIGQDELNELVLRSLSANST